MKQAWLIGFLLCLGCSSAQDTSKSPAAPVPPAEISKATAVKQQAEAMCEASARHDCAGIIDRTYPGVVAAYGGREEAIRRTSKMLGPMLAEMKEKGMSEPVITVGEPGEFYTEGGNMFVVVPTRIEIRMKGGTVRSEAYMLGISSDGGAQWTFIDAGGFQDQKYREQVLPKLPVNMKLPTLKKARPANVTG